MRTIKFRGKSIATGEWIYGGFVHVIKEYLDLFAIVLDDLSMVSVKHGTVGQYTGLKDRKGVDIYEGDILQVMGVGGHCRRQVEFHDGAFHTGYHNGSSTKETPVLIQKRVLVLGNIYDNPELLKQH